MKKRKKKLIYTLRKLKTNRKRREEEKQTNTLQKSSSNVSFLSVTLESVVSAIWKCYIECSSHCFIRMRMKREGRSNLISMKIQQTLIRIIIDSMKGVIHAILIAENCVPLCWSSFFWKSICYSSPYLSLQFASEYDTIPWFEYDFKDFISLWMYTDAFHFGLISQTSSHETERKQVKYLSSNKQFSLVWLLSLLVMVYINSILSSA